MAEPQLPAGVEEVFARLRDAGLRAYLVGGAPRDAWLGREIRDFDLLVEAATLEPIRRALPGARRLDAANPVVALEARDGDRSRVEISVPREGAQNLVEDLRLRDFTANAIAFDPESRVWIDPFGGRDDLAAERLRATNPATVFVADSLRICRGARLAFELGLEIDPPTWRAMCRQSWRLAGGAGERLRDELFRSLEAPNPAPLLERLRACGALAALLPESLLDAGFDAWPGGPRIDEHLLALVGRLRPDPQPRLAAWLSASGYAETRRYLARRGVTILQRPEFAAAARLRGAARRLRFSRRETTGIERRIRHSRLRLARAASDASIRRMLHRVGRDILEDVLELRRVDLALRRDGGDPGVPAELVAAWTEHSTRVLRVAASDESWREEALRIGGKEVMQELGIPEGPEVHRWLMRARRRVWASPEENDRELLLGWLRDARTSGTGH